MQFNAEFSVDVNSNSVITKCMDHFYILISEKYWEQRLFTV